MYVKTQVCSYPWRVQVPCDRPYTADEVENGVRDGRTTVEQMRADILQYFADGNPVRVRPHLSPHENDSSVLVMKSELMHGRDVLNAIMSACTKSNQLEPAALIRVTSVGMKASLAEMQEMLRGLVDNRDYQFHRNNYDISFGHTVTVKFPPNKSAGNRPSTAAVLNMVSIDVIQVRSFLV